MRLSAFAAVGAGAGAWVQSGWPGIGGGVVPESQSRRNAVTSSDAATVNV